MLALGNFVWVYAFLSDLVAIASRYSGDANVGEQALRPTAALVRDRLSPAPPLVRSL